MRVGLKSSICLIFVVLVAEALHLQLDGLLFFLDARQLALRFVQLRLHVVEVVDVLFLLALELYIEISDSFVVC